MPSPSLYEPGARDPVIRAAGPYLPLLHRLPRPIHYAMAGGGSHGAVQWGLLQALSETDVAPDQIIGSSAGALSGVVFAEDPPSGLNRLAYVWAQLDTKYVIGENWITRLANARQIALVDNTTERSTLESLLTARRFDELALPFATVATDLATGLSTVLDSGELIPALLASSAIPGLLPPVTIDDRLLVDGLASANLPAVPAVQRGAGAVIVLDTGGRDLGEPSTSTRKVITRLSASLGQAQRRDQLRDAAAHVPVLLLPTPGDLGGTLDFRQTMQSAAGAYTMARAFLRDLATAGTGLLAPGLYARADARGIGTALDDVLTAVVP
jgi:NTE family protein